MKKLMSILALSFVLSAGAAQAQEGVAVFNADGTVGIEPLGGYCPPQPTREDFMTMQSCDPGTDTECPAHYEETAKYCWGGWGTGFYRCGTACKPPRDHEGRGGDRGGKGGRGGHGGHGGHGDHEGRGRN